MASKESINPSSVLVIGASGYIGFAVARAFRQAGYFVYGVIRNENKKALLLAHEIIPVIADGTKVEEYKDYIQACPLIIDTTNSMTDNQSEPEKLPLKILEAAEEASKNRDPLLPPKIFIYTSGIMVYGHDDRIRDEAWPVSTTKYANFRRKVEEAVTHSTHVSGIVIRPAWVFGGSVGPFGDRIFTNPDKLVLYGRNHDRRHSWVHIDDLAEAYVAAAAKSQATRGLIFNIVNGYDAPKHSDLALRAARLAGYKGELHWEESRNWIDELVDASVVLNSLQATTIFGWTPKIFGFLDNLEFYYQVYKATKALHK